MNSVATRSENETATATLSVRDLHVGFRTRRGLFAAVAGVSFDVQPGETLGIVGESGSGKSVSMLAILGLLPPGPRWEVAGQALLSGRDLLRLRPDELRQVRGESVAMIFQNPTSSLNPVFTVGDQVGEAIRVHNASIRSAEVRDRVLHLLELVGISNPQRRAQQYPHEFSGGMAQRAMIAMALANSPALLIADEPTTALDVTIQAQILEVLRNALREFNTSLVLITHNLSLVAELADRVAVMYAGNVVETAGVDDLFHHPRHPYTVGLMRSVPSLDRQAERLVQIPGQQPSPSNRPTGCPFHTRCYLSHGRDRCVSALPGLTSTDDPRHLSACHYWPEVETTEVLVEWTADVSVSLVDVVDLAKYFPITSGVLRRVVGQVRALDGVTWSLAAGETLALVGESGCGKSTLARTVIRLIEPTDGSIKFRGQDVTRVTGGDLRRFRRRIQMVFQDPYSSLNPRLSARQSVAEPMRIHHLYDAVVERTRVDELLDRVGIPHQDADRLSGQFSGGQRQRIAIARALALEPQVVVLDEPVAALDVSTQAQILNLLRDLQKDLGVAYLFISHDLAVVRQIADRVAVMYLGKIVETGEARAIYEHPSHPYVKALLSAVPISDPALRGRRQRIILRGEVPNPAAPPSGCRFRTRCWKAQGVCADEAPALVDRGAGHPVACHFPE